MEKATAAAETPSERCARERHAAEARMDRSEEEGEKRGQHLAEEEEKEKAEQEEKLRAAAGVDEEIEWQKRWGDAGCSVGMEESQVRALEVLLSHYPFVVALGLFGFWRTMHIRVWSSEFWGKAGLPPLTGKVPPEDRLAVPLHLGIKGCLNIFTSQLLPAPFPRSRGGDKTLPRPPLSAMCNLTPWIDAPQGVRSVKERYSYVGGNFIAGLILAQHMDVLSILVKDLDFDLAEPLWSYGVALPTGLCIGSVLHIACHSPSVGGLRTVQLLLAQSMQREIGFNVESDTQYTNSLWRGKITPLMVAVERKNTDVVALLLEQPTVDVNFIDSARGVDRSPHVTRLLSSSITSTTLMYYHCATALHIAAEGGSLEICKRLVECDQVCDVNVIGGANGTALHMAVKKCHKEIVALLLQQADISASVDAVDDSRLTPLQVVDRLLQGKPDEKSGIRSEIHKMLSDFDRSEKQ